MTSCLACRVLRQRFDPATAFLAGLAFAYTHNDDAVRRSLCAEHATELLGRAAAADRAIKDEDRRRRVTS